MFQEIQPFKRRRVRVDPDGIAPVDVAAQPRKRTILSNWLFLVTVAIPTVIAIVYYGFLASDIYISESKFVVRSPD